MPSLPVMPSVIGSFTVESLIGRGGMGLVFLARQTGLNRPVALKVLDPGFVEDREFVQRFRHEAHTLGQLDSLHVVGIYDYGEADGLLYLAMQYISGGDLDRYIRQNGKLAVPAALSVFAQILDGLRDAHAAGVLHRDVKPSNVLLRADRDEPFVYLCDFGIAHSGEADGLTQTGFVPGSVYFMAPERHLGKPASVQSDIYAAACVLWVMVAGVVPFSGTDLQVISGHLSGPVPQLPGVGINVGRVNRVLRECMAKSPDDRPGCVDDVLASLRRTEPVEFSAVMPAVDVLKDPTTSGVLLAQIAETQPDLRVQVAKHPNAYPGLLDWLATYGAPEVREAVDERQKAEEPCDIALSKVASVSVALAGEVDGVAPYDEVPSKLVPVAADVTVTVLKQNRKQPPKTGPKCNSRIACDRVLRFRNMDYVLCSDCIIRVDDTGNGGRFSSRSISSGVLFAVEDLMFEAYVDPSRRNGVSLGLVEIGDRGQRFTVPIDSSTIDMSTADSCVLEGVTAIEDGIVCNLTLFPDKTSASQVTQIIAIFMDGSVFALSSLAANLSTLGVSNGYIYCVWPDESICRIPFDITDPTPVSFSRLDWTTVDMPGPVGQVICSNMDDAGLVSLMTYPDGADAMTLDLVTGRQIDRWHPRRSGMTLSRDFYRHNSTVYWTARASGAASVEQLSRAGGVSSLLWQDTSGTEWDTLGMTHQGLYYLRNRSSVYRSPINGTGIPTKVWSKTPWVDRRVDSVRRTGMTSA